MCSHPVQSTGHGHASRTLYCLRERKASGAPAECASCRHLEICRGGCPKFWREGAEGGVEQYLCGDMRLFFDAKRAALEGMAKAVRERWREWGAGGSKG